MSKTEFISLSQWAGESAVSDPTVSKNNDSIILCFEVPMKGNGQIIASLY